MKILASTNIKFRKKFENNHGTIFITTKADLSVSGLTKIWTKYKKIVQEKYDIDVMANFYDINRNTKKGLFFLNRAYAEKNKIDDYIYEHRFADTFQFWIIGFESIVNSIVFDIENAKAHTEEKKDKISERILKNYASAIEIHLLKLTDAQMQIQKLRAERKATNAKRKAEARAKKAAKQDLSHQD